MKKKFAKKVLFSTVAMTLFASSASLSADAAYYSNYIARGFENLCFVRTDFNWYTDWRGGISESDAHQNASGFNAKEGGKYRTYKSGFQHDWLAIANYTIGISKDGVSMGYTYSIRDKVELTNGGCMNVYWREG